MLRVEFAGGQVHFQEGPGLMPGPGEALVRVVACGVCGTDAHLLDGTIVPPGPPGPVRPGHEVAGIVEALPDAAPGDLRVGGMIVLHPLDPCGSCPACTGGQEHRCTRARVLGVTAPGGLAEQIVWPARRLVPADGLPPEQAALLPDAVATAYHALSDAEVPAGGTLVVIGAGGVGTHVLQLAQVLDPKMRLLAVVRSTATADRLAGLGVETVRGLETAGPEVRRRLGGADAVIDFTGSAATPRYGLPMLARGGRLILGSVIDEPLELDASVTTFVNRELTVRGSYTSRIADLRAVTELARSGALDLAGSASVRLPLERAAEALALLHSRPAGMVRVVVEP